MKNILMLVVIATSIFCSQAQNAAFTNRPEWKVTFHVADEDGKPVSGADAKVAYYIKPPPGKSTAMDSVQGKTDTNGSFIATGRSHFMLSCSAKKEGYYPAEISYELGLAYQYDPVKWNPTLKLELKKIKNPIPMYAKRIRQGPPVVKKPVGYDLEAGDWVAPYGKGNNKDMIFNAYYEKRAENDWDYKLVVSFPNPIDGIQQFKISEPGKTSSLRSPHEAPENGYQPEWVKTQSQRPGQPSVYGIDKDLNFFFRVRTILDEKGNVKSASYGKIYGDFMDFQYFFNPESNSRNVEFDPTKNLMKNLGTSEHVNQP